MLGSSHAKIGISQGFSSHKNIDIETDVIYSSTSTGGLWLKKSGEYTFQIRGAGKIRPTGLTITLSNQAGNYDSVYSINNFTDQGQGKYTFQHTFDDVFAYKAKEDNGYNVLYPIRIQFGSSELVKQAPNFFPYLR